jgi:hypothetical protein
MRYHAMPKSVRAKLRAAADPSCDECDGDGVLSICSNNNPDTEREIACDCVDLSDFPLDDDYGPADAH